MPVLPKIIEGKFIADTIKDEIAVEVRKIIASGKRPPHLVAVLVGMDPASESYVSGKEKACKQVGFISSVYRYPEGISQEKLLEVVNFLNNDEEVDGFIVQLPLPEGLREDVIIESIDYRKDVDGFHPANAGRMMKNLPCFLPATPMGILTLLERSNIDTEGKNCVVLGRSNIVGTPVSILMGRKAKPGNSTVTLCHSKTKNITEICSRADILIAAIGQPHFVKADMVKEGAVVIDVGIHRIPDNTSPKGYKIIGDVAFDEVMKKCSFISPVPGGVGLLTIVSLLQNTLKAYRKEIYP
ncbi:MAG: bifunctional 5,10-methylene-tetrahydrofolate dehydrogenase/5,10-methylene-tetrahydrofolate cyclohydrolase [Bacteroidetes bacterium]|nr:bifunctional 5,10-methylene-tetrahydrofolate dehydrogenase/5,10-methylene-tetrahydrofolate cyclohydrolase [Bacteroidota bacterium]